LDEYIDEDGVVALSENIIKLEIYESSYFELLFECLYDFVGIIIVF
jgi:hypothetical protein